MIIRPLIAATTVLLFVGSVFAAQTMRVDYYHTGDATQEIFSVERVVIEPLPWPGHSSQALDTSNLGKIHLRSPRREDEATALLARARIDLRRMGNDRRSEGDQANVSGIVSLSRARRSGRNRSEETRRQKRLSKHLDYYS
jgi:hypothetical protein